MLLRIRPPASPKYFSQATCFLGERPNVLHIPQSEALKDNTSPSARNVIVQEAPKSTLSYSWDVSQPSDAQLQRAKEFFLRYKPQFLFSATKLLNIPFTSVPEVAFLGRSNVGKSSILNAIMGHHICHTSSKPGRTKSMNAFAVGGQDSLGNKGHINVLDMPGYGKGSHAEWGKEIMKYLVARKELKRVFVLVDAVHGLKGLDAELLRLLRHNGISHQVILSKVDRTLCAIPHQRKVTERALWQSSSALRKLCKSLKTEIQPKDDGIPAIGQILFCSTSGLKDKNLSLERGGMLGINLLRHAVLVATGVFGTEYKMAGK